MNSLTQNFRLLERLRTRGIKFGLAYLNAVLSGALMMLSMPGYNLPFLAWFGLIPLLLVLPGKSKFNQFLLIHITTIVWSIGTHWWYPSIFSLWGYLLMLAGGLYYGGFFKMGYDMQHRIKSWYSIFAIPVTFSLFEWLKTILPFTKTWWIELIAKSQWTVPENLQILSITSFSGLTFLILLTNVVIAKLFQYRAILGRRHLLYALLLVLPVMNFIYGKFQMSVNEAMLARSPISIGAIVDMVNQDKDVTSLGNSELAGDGYLADTPQMKKKIFEIDRDLSRSIQFEKKPDIIVWGENEFMNQDDRWLHDNLSALSKELGAAIVVDTVWETKGKIFDTAVMMSSDGKEVGRTPKIFTLWGEEAHGFSPGPKDYRIHQSPYGKIALAVCWDRHDPSILRGYANRGAEIALIPSDDDFNGDSRFPYFAASDAVFRAVENRIAIASGSTSGLAYVVTPYGNITAISEINKRDYIVGNTFILKGTSVYTKYGDVFAYLLSGVYIGLLILSERAKRVLAKERPRKQN